MRIHNAIKKLRMEFLDSQQGFATKLGISVRGLANYENNRVPPILVLAKIQELSMLCSDEAARKAIDKAFLDELKKTLHGQVLAFASESDDSSGGLMFRVLKTRDNYAYAVAFMLMMNQLEHGHLNREYATKALEALFEAAAVFLPPGAQEALRRDISKKTW